MKKYCPGTHPVYKFTRPYTKKGVKSEYFSLLISMYDGREFSNKDAHNMRLFLTVQHLRIAGLIEFVDGMNRISQEGADYVVTHLAEYDEIMKQSVISKRIVLTDGDFRKGMTGQLFGSNLSREQIHHAELIIYNNGYSLSFLKAKRGINYYLNLMLNS